LNRPAVKSELLIRERRLLPLVESFMLFLLSPWWVCEVLR